MLSRQKLAILGFAVAAGLVVLGRWGMSEPAPRWKDLAAIFGGGFVAALASVRFVKNWSSATAPPAAESSSVPPPRTKS